MATISESFPILELSLSEAFYWVIAACKTYSNQPILSLKTESTWIEQEPSMEAESA